MCRLAELTKEQNVFFFFGDAALFLLLSAGRGEGGVRKGEEE